MLAGLFASCAIEPDLVRCGDQLCRQGLVCTAAGCASPEAQAACDGIADGELCTTSQIPAGTCSSGVCFEVVCGNAIVDRGAGEACDDGNRVDGDGCAADCSSDETCGNDVADVLLGEECDSGIDGLAEDGCSSTCKVEVELWRNVSPAGVSPLVGISIAYDSTRQRVVLFGGRYLTASSETYELDGVQWLRFDPPRRPPARQQHATAYDVARRRTIVFGGSDGSNALGDTWLWDGVTWTQPTLTVSPPARALAVMAYDPARARTVLFGGVGASGLLGDTWEWDGSSWSQVATTGPSPRSGASMVYSALDGKILLFGGDSPAKQADTWVWDGTAWAQLSPTTSPSARAGAGIAGQANRVVLFGGFASGGVTNDVHVWNGTTWTATATTGGPPPVRGYAGMTYDAARDEIVLYGGSQGGDPYGDLWSLQGTDWDPVVPPVPLARASHAMAYDLRRGQVVMTGGSNATGTGIRLDQWRWDGLNWRPALPLPGARRGHVMVYDSKRDRLVVFGGIAPPVVYRNEHFEFDGTTWTANDMTRPSSRAYSGAAYDSVRGRTVVFGGVFINGMVTTRFDETWEFDGTSWTQRQPVTRPSARESTAMAFDALRGRVVLFGGVDDTLAEVSDTWEWDGTSWQLLTPASSPPRRSGHILVYDPVRRKVVLSGGRTASMIYDDVWEWDGVNWERTVPTVAPPAWGEHAGAYHAVSRRLNVFAGETNQIGDRTFARSFEAVVSPAEGCKDGALDTDGDTLAGCADPDCFGRCTPFCVPGAPCDMTLPRCGNATCEPVEDYLICPGDCPVP